MRLPTFLRREQLDEHGNIVEKSIGARIRTVLIVLLVLCVNVFLVIRATTSCAVPLSEELLLTEIGKQSFAQAALSLPKPQSFRQFTVRDDAAQGVLLYRLLGTGRLGENGEVVSDFGLIDEKGHLQVQDVVYLDGADCLQFTVRQNTRHYPAKTASGEPGLSFVLRVFNEDGDESLYTSTSVLCHSETLERRGYLYTRYVIDGLPLKLGADYVTLCLFDTDELHAALSSFSETQSGFLSLDALLTRVWPKLQATLHSQISSTALDTLHDKTFRHVS